jgi:hypothetical protein
MSNSLLTISMITREAVRLWKNSNAFIQNIDTQYDDSFAKTGAKIGTQLKIRLPNDYIVRTGAAAQVQDTTEQQTTLTVATQKGVDVSFTSVDMALSLDDFSSRIMAPMVNNLAGAVAYDVMGGVEGGISNFTANSDSSGNVISPNSQTWLNAGALLDINSCPRGDSRKAIVDPFSMARTVTSLAGLFNPTNEISGQYRTGMMGRALGMEFFQDQTVIKHTTSSYSGSLTVNGANQTGSTLTVNAITGGFAVGDIITIAGVNAVDRITKQTTGQLRQFVITATAATGATSLSIYPAIVPPVGGNPVQYQTVTASPANSAVITPVTLSASLYRKNFVFAPEAVTMVTADLPQIKNVENAREMFDNISMRMVAQYNIGTDQYITRLDVLYGYLWVRPDWACVVADAI